MTLKAAEFWANAIAHLFLGQQFHIISHNSGRPSQGLQALLFQSFCPGTMVYDTVGAAVNIDHPHTNGDLTDSDKWGVEINTRGINLFLGGEITAHYGQNTCEIRAKSPRHSLHPYEYLIVPAMVPSKATVRGRSDDWRKLRNYEQSYDLLFPEVDWKRVEWGKPMRGI